MISRRKDPPEYCNGDEATMELHGNSKSLSI